MIYRSGKVIALVCILAFTLSMLGGCDGGTGTGILESYNVSGEITDEAGQPLAGVTVIFSGDSSGQEVTDSQGRWETSLQGRVTITPQKSGYEFEPADRTVTSSRSNLNFTGYPDDDDDDPGDPGDDDDDPDDSDDDDDEISDPDLVIDIEYDRSEDIKDLYDNVRKFEPEEQKNIQSFSQQQGRLVFSERTGFVESLQPGDVIIADPDDDNKTPYGLIHHIESVSADGLTFSLVDATLEDVIEDGEINVSGSFDFEDLVQGMVVAQDVRILDIDFGEQKIEFEREFSGDRGKVSGHIKMHSTLDFDKNIRYRVRLDYLKFILNAAIEIDVNYEALKGAEKDELIDLFVLQGPPIAIFTGVWVNPRIAFRAGAKASIEGGATTGVTWSREYSGGLEYTRAGGFETVYSFGGAGWQIKPVTLKASAEAQAFAGIALEGLIWGRAGFGVGIMGYTQAKGEVNIDHTQWAWEYDVSLGAKVVSKAQLELGRIASRTYDGPEYDFFRVPLAFAASGRVIEEIENEDGETEEVGLAEVEIHFEGSGAGGRELTTVTTNEEGFWYQDLMAGEVTVIPEKTGYEFEPEEIEVDKGRSDVNFTAEAGDLTGTWPGTMTIRNLAELSALMAFAQDEGCEIFEDLDLLEMLIDTPLNIRLELERREEEHLYDAEMFLLETEISGNSSAALEEFVSNQDELVRTLEDESFRLDGVFENNTLTLTTIEDGASVEYIGNLVENNKLRGPFSISDDEFRITGDWAVERRE